MCCTFCKWQEAGVFRDGGVTGPGWPSVSGAAEWRMHGGRGCGNSGGKARGGMVISYDSGREQEGQKRLRGKSDRV